MVTLIYIRAAWSASCGLKVMRSTIWANSCSQEKHIMSDVPPKSAEIRGVWLKRWLDVPWWGQCPHARPLSRLSELEWSQLQGMYFKRGRQCDPSWYGRWRYMVVRPVGVRHIFYKMLLHHFLRLGNSSDFSIPQTDFICQMKINCKCFIRLNFT